MYNNTRGESRGALFPRQKKTQNSPDNTGDFILTGPSLDYVTDQLRNGASEIKLYVSAWVKQDRSNQPMLSFTVRPPMEATQQGGNNGYNPQSNVPQRQGYTATASQPLNPPNQQGYGQQSGGGFRNATGGGFPSQPNRMGRTQNPGSQTHPEKGHNPALNFPGDDEVPF